MVGQPKLKQYEFSALATFNAERGRGIVHTELWREWMAKEQELFDAGKPSEFHRRWERVHSVEVA